MDVRAGELIVDPGAGSGALAIGLARRGARVIAVELDPVWAHRLAQRATSVGPGEIRVVQGDILSTRLPTRPYRVVGCPPFGETTALLRRLLDPRRSALPVRVDLVVQWEVARKRALSPPGTLLGTTWAPWWDFRLGARILATAFRPVPRVDAAVLTILRRDPPLLPTTMAVPYADFVRFHWPFPKE